LHSGDNQLATASDVHNLPVADAEMMQTMAWNQHQLQPQQQSQQQYNAADNTDTLQIGHTQSYGVFCHSFPCICCKQSVLSVSVVIEAASVSQLSFMSFAVLCLFI